MYYYNLSGGPIMDLKTDIPSVSLFPGGDMGCDVRPAIALRYGPGIYLILQRLVSRAMISNRRA